MKHCPKCNARVGAQYLFCEECGADLWKKQIIKKPKRRVVKKAKKEEIKDLKKQIEGLREEFEQKLINVRKRNSELKRRLETLEGEEGVKKLEIIEGLNKKLSEFERKEEQKVSNIFKSIISGINQKFEGIKKKSKEKPKKKRKIKPIPQKKAKESGKKPFLKKSDEAIIRFGKRIHHKIKGIRQLRIPNITKQNKKEVIKNG